MFRPFVLSVRVIYIYSCERPIITAELNFALFKEINFESFSFFAPNLLLNSKVVFVGIFMFLFLPIIGRVCVLLCNL